MAVVEQELRYLVPSAVSLAGARADLLLATSGGRTVEGPAEHPRFFDGFLGHAEQSAVALLVVARVARTRYYMPPGMLAAVLRSADPVVTANGDRLRFESFSACCGVYARLDLLPEALDGRALDRGTTNVDFNPPMREALARVGGIEPLHLQVGADDVTIRTLDATVVERKVPLPERWLKGFAEVQVAAARMLPAAELAAVPARRFLRALPRSGRGPLWAIPAGGSLRLTSRPTAGAVCLPGPERLRAVEPLLRYARGLRVYGPEVDARATAAPSGWEVTLDDARLVVVLSPEVSRGFSGEGGVLFDLADEATTDDATLVGDRLVFQPRIDVPEVARDCGLVEERVRRALVALGASGRVGYDLADAGFFHRELPYDPDALAAMHPRLRDARALLDAGAVTLVPGGARVRGEDVEHRVTFADGAPSVGSADGAPSVGSADGAPSVGSADGAAHRCTCPWWGRHRGTRGPCKHVLAATLARRA